jgi:PPOX class probable F420-dependent enzyme
MTQTQTLEPRSPLDVQRVRRALGIGGKYLELTTFRRDGSPVATPVWFEVDGADILALTSPTSGKVRRIAHDPRVRFAACSARGKVRGETFDGIASVAPEDVDEVKRLMARKYRFDLLFVRPIRWFQLRRHPERRAETAVRIRPR